MLDKTKAAMRGRQCSTENKEQGQHTRLVAGGQSLTAPVITGTTPLARLMGDLAHRVNNFYSALRVTKSHAHLQTTQKLGCLGCTALQHTPYLNRCRGCEPVAHTLLLRSPVLVSSNIGYHSLSASFAFLRCRRLISPLAAVTRNAAVLSPSSLRRSISSITSWGILIVVICDFAFLAPVAITVIPCVWCISVYAKKMRRKDLRCISLWSSFNSGGDIHLINAKPGSARTLTGPLTKPLSEVTTMAELQSTQTRPEFTWLFLATPKHYPECAPVVLRFDADTESSARAAFPGWELVFAAKIRAQAPCRVSFFDYSTRRGWEFDSAASQGVRHA